MPLNYQPNDPIPFTAHDFLYGMDTGQLKARSYFYQNFVAPLKAQGQIWHGHHADDHKIDCLTQGLSPNPTNEISNVQNSSDLSLQVQEWRNKNTKSVLQHGWDTKYTKKNSWREADQVSYLEFISQSRYSPQLSKEAEHWNQRFKRTSKFGLFWALFVRRCNVHFITEPPGKFSYSSAVAGSKNGSGYSKFTKTYGSSSEDKIIQVEEKRITWAEMRWIFRYKSYAAVSDHVQFWEMEDAYEFNAVPAPWNDIRYKNIWAGYNPLLDKQKNSDDVMAKYLKALDKGEEFEPPPPMEVVWVKEKLGKMQLYAGVTAEGDSFYY